uniref:Uncharacterized protein n=1 Tax=Strombidium inclinatum TaxID=197538 RepID=A0A7S3IYD4_9SPIT
MRSIRHQEGPIAGNLVSIAFSPLSDEVVLQQPVRAGCLLVELVGLLVDRHHGVVEVADQDANLAVQLLGGRNSHLAALGHAGPEVGVPGNLEGLGLLVREVEIHESVPIVAVVQGADQLLVQVLREAIRAVFASGLALLQVGLSTADCVLELIV